MKYVVPIWQQGTIQFVTIGHDKTFAKAAFWQDTDFLRTKCNYRKKEMLTIFSAEIEFVWGDYPVDKLLLTLPLALLIQSVFHDRV